MSDPYASHAPSAAGPASRLFAIVPNDATDLPFVTTGIYIGTGGDLTVRDLDGSIVTFKVTSGAGLPIRIARVMATGTTATDLVGMV